ncbi:MAG TPA: histidine kinase [Gaiellaceae bacterium]|nr:histidine kinase [Gaiellaceae bacterium]
MPSPSTATRAVLSEIERWPVRAELLRELRPQDGSGYRRSSLYTRVLLVNVVVLVAASAVLAFTPARVPFPSSVEKVGVLVAGLIVMVVANALLLRVSFGPLAQLVKQMRTIDLLMPGQRIPVAGGVEVRTVIEGFNEMLARLESERRRSIGHALMLQDEERRRIGQELHDDIGQRLTAILLQLKRAEVEAPEAILRYLREAQEQARDTIDEIGRLAWQLRPGILDDLGLTKALDALAHSFEESTGVRVERTLDHGLPRLDWTSELAVYRVAQEALTNAFRHGNPARVHLNLLVDGGHVRLEVEDDGTGLTDDFVEDWGIRGMRERALLVGARFEIESPPEGGTRVTFELPRGWDR